jgi:hypothetical protein
MFQLDEEEFGVLTSQIVNSAGEDASREPLRVY